MLPLEKANLFEHFQVPSGSISKYCQSSDWVERLANQIVSKIVNDKKNRPNPEKKALVSNQKPIHIIVK